MTAHVDRPSIATLSTQIILIHTLRFIGTDDNIISGLPKTKKKKAFGMAVYTNSSALNIEIRTKFILAFSPLNLCKSQLM
jgi:hypothetical protein